MEEKETKKSYIPGILVLSVMFIFFFVLLVPSFYPDYEVGDNVLAEKKVIPIDLEVVHIDNENTYLIDEKRNNIIMIDNEGNETIYEFVFGGSVHLTNVNSSENLFTVYFTRLQVYYIIDFSGDIVDTYPLEPDTIRERLEYSDEYGNYKVDNKLVMINVYDQEDLIYSSLSLMPIIILCILIYSTGMLYSLKRYNKTLETS